MMQCTNNRYAAARRTVHIFKSRGGEGIPLLVDFKLYFKKQ